LDLNAATIDNDPRKDLTKRYERILSYLTSDDLEYISSDSMCFAFAIDKYKKSKKEASDLQEFLLIAGANYDSPLPNKKVLGRNEKLTSCFYKMKDYITENKVDSNSPELLRNVDSFAKKNNLKSEQDWIGTL
jgi:hypothetical protein